MRARALVAGGFLAGVIAVAVSGCAAGAVGAAGAAAVPGRPAASAPSAVGPAGCTAAADDAIRARQRLTEVPAACRPLTPAERNAAVGLAIRMAAGTGSKSQWRRQAGTAAAYVSTLITGPAPIGPAPSGAAAGPPGGEGTATASAPAGSRLGFSERAAEVAALVAWLATAGSGGWILGRWWRAGGRPARGRDRTDTTAPSAVILGHAGLGLLGLVLWAVFMATGWAALAWIAVGLLCPVAGLGLAVLFSGLPRPRSHASAPRSGRQPVAVIAAHGLFVLATLLLVLLAAVGA